LKCLKPALQPTHQTAEWTAEPGNEQELSFSLSGFTPYVLQSYYLSPLALTEGITHEYRSTKAKITGHQELQVNQVSVFYNDSVTGSTCMLSSVTVQETVTLHQSPHDTKMVQ